MRFFIRLYQSIIIFKTNFLIKICDFGDVYKADKNNDYIYINIYMIPSIFRMYYPNIYLLKNYQFHQQMILILIPNTPLIIFSLLTSHLILAMQIFQIPSQVQKAQSLLINSNALHLSHSIYQTIIRTVLN